MRRSHADFIVKLLLFIVVFSVLAKFFVYVGVLAALYFSIRMMRAM